MPNVYKVLGQQNPLAANLTTLYTVPALTSTVISSIVATNRSSVATSFRVSVAVAGAVDNVSQYVAYDVAIQGNDVVALSLGITLGAADVVRCYSTLATLTFTAFGEEIS